VKQGGVYIAWQGVRSHDGASLCHAI